MWTSRVFCSLRRSSLRVVLATVSLSFAAGLTSSQFKRRIELPRTVACCQQSQSSSFELTSNNEDKLNKRLNDKSHFQKLPKPERSMFSSHAIYGALFQPNLVESYDTYKNLEFSEDGEGRKQDVVVAKVKIGKGLDGHPGIVHGGILSLLIDDTLGAAYFAMGTVPHAVTANLNVNYRRGVPAGSTILVRCQLVERVRRKLLWRVVVECPESGELYCEATSLFVIPKKFLETQEIDKPEAA